MTKLFQVKTHIRAGMTNPASTYCEQEGGDWSALDLPQCGGEVGLCAFPSGDICEEWAFFRGECEPGLFLAQ